MTAPDLSDLRAAIEDEHREAESHRFVRLVLSDRLPPEAWATLLDSRSQVYLTLESVLLESDQPPGRLEERDLMTYERMQDDLEALVAAGHGPETDIVALPPAIRHIRRVRRLHGSGDPATESLLLAHVYALHLGDALGGQILSRHLPERARTTYKIWDRTSHVVRIRESVAEAYHSHPDPSAFEEEARLAVRLTRDLFEAVCLAHGL